MKKLLLIFLGIAAMLLAVGCERLDQPTTDLNIFVRLPDQIATKAEDPIAPEANESRINDLKIWVFVNRFEEGSNLEKGELLGYLAPKQLNVADGKVQKFTVTMDRKMASAIKSVDIYVLANTVSAGFQKDFYFIDGVWRGWEELKINQLKGIVMTGGIFGTVKEDNTNIYRPSNTSVTDVVGLPYTACGEDLDVTGKSAELSVTSVELVRAVSKVQFFFSQVKDNAGNTPIDFEVTGLELYGTQIAEKEYIFPNVSYDGGYLTDNLVFSSVPTKATIAASTNPATYAYSGESAQSYLNKLLTAATATGPEVSRGPVCYLREGGKKLKGKLTYTFGGVAGKTQEFEMVEDAFTRNSNWIVYFYFTDTTLGFTVASAPWGNGGQYTIVGE